MVSVEEALGVADRQGAGNFFHQPMKFIRIIYILLAIVAVLFLARALFFKGDGTKTTISINNTPITLMLALTDEARAQGLSGKPSLDTDQGMWFVFPESGKQGIWMKDMKFPIDIAWIDENFVIVDIKEHAQPESYPEIFYPKANSRYVLEVNDGFLQKHAIKIGDLVSF